LSLARPLPSSAGEVIVKENTGIKFLWSQELCEQGINTIPPLPEYDMSGIGSVNISEYNQLIELLWERSLHCIRAAATLVPPCPSGTRRPGEGILRAKKYGISLSRLLQKVFPDCLNFQGIPLECKMKI